MAEVFRGMSPATAQSVDLSSEGKNQVNVYVLTADTSSDDAHLVYDMFQGHLFKVQFAKIQTPEELTDAEKEWFRLRWVLEYSLKKGDKHIIVVKDTTVTNADTATIREQVHTAVQMNDHDIMYLCKWRDECHKHSNHKVIANSTRGFVTTVSPHGTQCLLISPEGRNILLSKKAMKDGRTFIFVGNEKIGEVLHKVAQQDLMRMRATKENLFNFNVARAKKDEDYLKTHECVAPNSASTPRADMFNNMHMMTDFPTTSSLSQVKPLVESGTKSTNFIWWLIFILGIIAIILLLIFGLRKRSRA